jgi:PAS domain S-box-containing protein
VRGAIAVDRSSARVRIGEPAGKAAAPGASPARNLRMKRRRSAAVAARTQQSSLPGVRSSRKEPFVATREGNSMQRHTAPRDGDAPRAADAVITTDRLTGRPTRPPDFAAENLVMQQLADTMATAPQRVLQELADRARALCQAGSAGISLLESGPPEPAARFRWVATSGEFTRYAGHTMPRDFSPCGCVLDANRMLMMTDPVRAFPYIEALSHAVHEVLLVPFHRGDRPIGTVWIAAHAGDRHFDLEDARLVTSLSKFASAVVQVLATAESNRKLEEDARLAAERELTHLAEENRRVSALSLERERAEAASRQSEARYRAMIEASPECVKIVAADGALLQMNPAGLAMIEAADEAAVLGGSIFDFIAVRDRARYREFHERVCRGESRTLTFEIVGARGTRRTMETSAVPLLSPDGGFHQLAISRDITERRCAEAALALELKDTQRLRDLAALLIGGDDPSALFDEILLAAVEVTGAEAGTIQLLDASTMTLSFLATRSFPAAMVEHFARVDASSDSPCGVALACGNRTFLHFDPCAAAGSSDRLHFDLGLRSVQSIPLLSRSGNPLGMISTHWRLPCDLTDREQRFLDLLGRQAADLIERSQVQEALRTADRRKDEFLAVLAHELRNPLVPIRSGVELLSRVREQPGLIDRIQPMMERQVAHVVRLIDDLLDVSRITSGRIELKPQNVTLASVVGSAVEATSTAISAAGLEFRMTLDEPDRLIEVDPTRFSQVIANILHNATKFTPSGGTVTLRAAIEDSPAGPELVLCIADTGVGVEPRLLPTIFGLFTQIHPDRSARHGGLGIGLALSRELVQLHGGTIAAESAGPGLGCQFTIRIPAAVAASRPLSSTPRAQSAGGQPRILVVDDNRDAADSTGLLMSSLGGDVRVAYDGAGALDQLRVFEPALVLLDIGMPELDGYELCRRIRQLRGRALSIVAVTGWGQEDDRRRAADAGFDAHLTKPVDAAELAALVTFAATGAGLADQGNRRQPFAAPR